MIRRDKIERRKSFMDFLLKYFNNKKIRTAEIGVAAGDFSKFLLDNLNITEHVMIDPWIEEGDDKRSQWFNNGNSALETYNFVVDGFRDYKNVIINRNYSHIFLFKSLMNGELFDLIYVDGDHHAEAVYFDLMLSWELINKEGVLCGDDYNWKSKSTGLFEVKRGVNKFETTHNLKFTVVNGDNGGLKQFFLKK